MLLAANHPNSLLDPIVLFRTAGRGSRPLAKAPLFEKRVVGRLIRVLGGIPVYRREDDPARMERNQDTFRAAVAALGQGDAIQIFPEGRSHSDPSISTLRTGAARMALRAEAEAGWTLGVRVVPVGLTYTRKPFFRGRAVAQYGEPIDVWRFRSDYEADDHAAARALTAELDRRLRSLTLELARHEDAELVDVAERLWAREKGLTTPRQRASLADRLPRLQAFARGLAWLRTHDPARHARLERAARRYARRARALGAGEGDLPDRYPLGATGRWLLTRALPVLLLAPVAALAAVVWGVPYRLVGWGVDRLRLEPDVVATYKLAGSLIAYPLALLVWVAVAGVVLGWAGAVGALVVLPLLGLVGIRWLDAAREGAEDVRVFARLRRHGGTAARLAEERAALVAEIDRVREGFV